MKNLSIILRIVAILAAIGAGALYYISQGELAEKQAQLDQTSSELEVRTEDLDSANDKIEELESELSDESEELEETEDSIESVRSEMKTAKEELSRTRRQVEELKGEVKEAKSENEELRKELAEGEEELADSVDETKLAEAEERLEELEAANEELESKLEASRKAQEESEAQKESESREETDAGKKRTQLTELSSREQTTDATVSIGPETDIASYSKDDGIILLSAHEDLNLKEGQKMTLVHEMEAVAKVQVARITDEGYAVTNMLPESPSSDKLEKGLTVTLLR
ncbi:MAG: hypothetical protein ACLFS4_05000 [Opitutales bacterium]